MVNRPVPVPKDFLTTRPDPRPGGAQQSRTPQSIPMPPRGCQERAQGSAGRLTEGQAPLETGIAGWTKSSLSASPRA